ncbi:MAG: phosphoglycerate mutase [Nitrosomonadales bacterium]|nr:phosphoglycerate mutase [Nitrosomonadales bacterium]
MKNVHLVIPDLFLPQEVAAEACAGLKLPALEKLLARAQSVPLPAESLEAWLCGAFGVADQAIAAVTLRADGMEPGAAYWLRADPVHLRLQRDQLILHPDVRLAADEAAQLCARLNAHFAGAGLRFFAPHPQRWYLQLDAAPDMTTHSLAQVAGRNVHAHLPQGPDALRWHGVFNEIQMLLFEHAVNQAREARGELPVNSVWLWGGGRAAGRLLRPYTKLCGDSDLAGAFAQTAGIPCEPLPDDVTRCVAGDDGDVLIVQEGMRRALQHGDLHAWRDALQRFEQDCAAPLLHALHAGRIAQLTLDVLQTGASRRFMLTHGAAWKLWRRPKPLARY